MAARKFLSSITTVNGSVTGVVFDTIAVGDLPSEVVRMDAANTFTVGPQTIVSDADNHVALIIKAHSATTTADLFEGLDSSGNVLFSINPNNGFTTTVVDVINAAVSFGLTLLHTLSAGAAAAGMGVGLILRCVVSNGTNRTQAQFYSTWINPVVGTRKARAVLSVFDTAEREVIRMEASGTAGKLGFFATTAVVQQVDGAALTNNVTSGGTTDTIADFTDLTTYANDAAAIHDDIYQLARKVRIIDDALRAYGLLT